MVRAETGTRVRRGNNCGTKPETDIDAGGRKTGQECMRSGGPGKHARNKKKKV